MSGIVKTESGKELVLNLTDNMDEIREFAKAVIANSPKKYKQSRIDFIKNYIRKKTGKEDIDDLFYRTVYDYWAYGTKVEEEFFNGLLEKNLEEKKEYMTYMEHVIMAYHLNDKNQKDLLYNKYKAYKFLKEYYKRDVILLTGNASEYEMFKEFVIKHNSFVVKPSDGHMGEGVYRETIENPTDENIKAVYDGLLKKMEFDKENAIAKELGCVLEEIFEQDERMGVFRKEGVNDVRCTTVRVGDEVKVFYPWLSAGRDDSFITTYDKGRILSGINVETGVVETDGITEDGDKYEKHPDTQVTFKGFQIPEWEELQRLVKELALKLPGINWVGWDMVLTTKGWAVQEANFAGEPVWQMIYGFGTKKEIEDFVGWKFTKEFWWQEDVEIN